MVAVTTTVPETAPQRRIPNNVAIPLLAVAVFAVIIGIPLLLRIFLLEAFQIPSGSMIPSLMPRDHMFVLKIRTPPQRGQVIVFKYPLDPKTEYVKRIVAVGGDTIAFRGAQMLINGVPAVQTNTDEPCTDGSTEAINDCRVALEQIEGQTHKIILMSKDPPDFGPQVIPPGHVFVVGDNRDNSNDSRIWGTVATDLIVGKALWIWWSNTPGRAFTRVQ